MTFKRMNTGMFVFRLLGYIAIMGIAVLRYRAIKKVDAETEVYYYDMDLALPVVILAVVLVMTRAVMTQMNFETMVMSRERTLQTCNKLLADAKNLEAFAGDDVEYSQFKRKFKSFRHDATQFLVLD
mmetsp:Transcript_90688/g.259096  ORF Transcript_90688/g.259096 Transcript_90688/m.259096 type:complete len:127 (+) Transcript_90688:53-433(+)